MYVVYGNTSKHGATRWSTSDINMCGRQKDMLAFVGMGYKGVDCSAKCTEMTPQVILKSAPHKMQTEPQDSLPLTPRLLIDGKPGECKQEVADSVMMDGCTNGTVKTAEPMAVDVDRTAMLGRDPTMACGVDEGTKMECEPQT